MGHEEVYCVARRGLLQSEHMKKYIVLLALVLLPVSTAYAASTDYLLEIDGVKGESSAKPTTTAPTRLTPSTSTEEQSKPEVEFKVEKGEALQNTGVEPDEIDFKATDDGEQEKKGGKGNVEYGWKVEEGEKAARSNFAVLFGAGNEISEQQRSEVASILLAGLAEGDRPAETLSLNYEEIKMSTKQSLKLFGFIPVSALVNVEVSKDMQTQVSYPWWAFLASGKDKTGLSSYVVNTLLEVMSEKTLEISKVVNRAQ